LNSIDFDQEFTKQYGELIAGIDEVGRGCLYGDVVAACVVMDLDNPIEGVTDSKKISPKKREKLYYEILEKAEAVGIGRVNCKIIDEINIKEATRLAMVKALDNLKDKSGDKVYPSLILIDAEEIDTSMCQKSITKGDELSYSIGCASIVAKVYRDKLCIKWNKLHPGYALSQNKGYGTKIHRKALLRYGPSEGHRLSFLTKILAERENQ